MEEWTCEMKRTFRKHLADIFFILVQELAPRCRYPWVHHVLLFKSSFILNGIWWFVGGRRFLMYLQTYLQYYSAVLLYMCSKQEHKADHGHKKGHAPRAQEGRSFTGISRPRTEVLRTRAYFSAANTLLRSRASRGHLNLFNRKDYTVFSF
jgi:hypothetical protein